jgi:hypothetical protein
MFGDYTYIAVLKKRKRKGVEYLVYNLWI